MGGKVSVVGWQLRHPGSGAASEVSYVHNSRQQKQEPELEKDQGKREMKEQRNQCRTQQDLVNAVLLEFQHGPQGLCWVALMCNATDDSVAHDRELRFTEATSPKSVIISVVELGLQSHLCLMTF